MLKLAKVTDRTTSSTTSARATAAFRSPPRRSTARAASASTSIRSASAKRPRTLKNRRRRQGEVPAIRICSPTDISEATVVTLYLLPSLNLKLMPKLNKELKPGTRIVSHAFDMGDCKPQQTLNVNGRTVYFWTTPIK